MCGGYALVNGFRSTGKGDQTQVYTLRSIIVIYFKQSICFINFLVFKENSRVTLLNSL